MELLNVVTMSSLEETTSENSEEGEFIIMAEVAPHHERVNSRQDLPEMLKVLDLVGLSWLTQYLLCCQKDWDNAYRVAEHVMVPTYF